MNITTYIEHTLLNPDVTTQQVQQLCDTAQEKSIKAICIPPYYVATANKKLEETPTKIATVVGFPMGYSTIPSKVEEAKRAVDEGADEINMVANLCAIKDGAWGHVNNDIDSVIRAAHLRGKLFKLILETHLLTTAEIRQMCELCVKHGVDMIQTSTDSSSKAPSIEIIEFLKQELNGEIKIKASGLIDSKQKCEQLIQVGASRLGTSTDLSLILEPSKA